MYDEKTPIINRQDTIQLMKELRKAIDSRINREIPGIVGLKKSAATVASHVVGIPVGGLGAISESTYFEQLRRIKFMQRLKTVVQSNPYKEPKYKDMYLKKLEQLAGK